ncbi:MAG TPA: NAD-dependent protein deacetylase [Polyangiaceae bacterium]|jgi:NAD-dependent SIR2 family protein deacetylase|nr:NAD-dependent protein deacetylase [Polyangiaceae bacterium]
MVEHEINEARIAHEDTEALLLQWVKQRGPWFVLTGAGCSTDSGIPAYRDRDGVWRHSPPITYQQFAGSASARARYWLRSMSGFPRMSAASPNAAHHALARLQALGKVSLLVTQNVDGLHHKAGSDPVLELHGSLAEVSCMACRAVWSRAEYQEELFTHNPYAPTNLGMDKPDGDVDLEPSSEHTFEVPACRACGGVVRPNVVFFGEGVPREKVDRSYAAVEQSAGTIVVGSSLAVFSGYRFVKATAQRGRPVLLINQGIGRADALAALRVDAPCGATLEQLTRSLGADA